MSEPKKRKQKPKPGRVVRISNLAWDFILSRTGERKNVRKAIDSLIAEVIEVERERRKQKRFFILPQSGIVCSSLEEARGQAILLALRKGRKKDFEQPIEVRTVG